MAALTPFTTSAVVPDLTTIPGIEIIRRYRAHEAIDAGEPVYQLGTSYSDGVALTDADAAPSAKVIGVAVNSAAAAGQYIDIMEYGLLTVGGTQTVGEWVWIHTTAGGLTITWADLASGDFASVVGYVYSATKLFVCPRIALVAKA